jgi:uncharacterized protein (TIGR02444 family)
MARILADLRQPSAIGFWFMSSNAASSADLPLWDYAVALYTKPQVADCCVQLQDTFNINVNLLLWCVWLEVLQIELTPERLSAAIALAETWDKSYVQTLRQMRRTMKMEFAKDLASVAVVRDQIKQAELLAEKQEHIWLEKLIEVWPSEANKIIAGKNLAFYLSAVNVPQSTIEQTLAAFFK